MDVHDIPVEELHNDPANVRKHGEQNLAAIKASLTRFGQQKPIVVNRDGVVIAGNGTLMAARALGWRTVKAVRTGLEGAEATAFAIADNRTAELAEWDEGALQQQLAAIAIEDEELLAATGYDEKELARLAAAAAPEVTEDEVPEPPADPVTQPGDLWLLGKHRLLCGDSTKAEDVERLMDGNKPFLMVTDPPYGVNYDPKWRENAKRTAYMEAEQDVEISWSKVWALFPGDVAYIWHSDRQRNPMQQAMESLGFEFRAELVWMKTVWPMGRGHWKSRHEPCCYFVRKGATARWNDVAKDAYDDTTVIEARPPGAAFGRTNDADAKEGGLTEHACQKPLECMAKPISRHGSEADVVYEPFCGSGSTLIAAEQLGRTCYGMEISPAYCDIIVKRWETLTGQKATRERP